jgi:hypothetical protein
VSNTGASRVLFQFTGTSGIANSGFIEAGGVSANSGYISINTNNAGTLAERMRITASGVLELAQGQIKFPATQVASSDPNTLDDYEEGTFDFGIAFGGSSTGVTYTNRQGKYTKIGNQVFVIGRIDLSSKGAEVGSATITGLPFSNGSSASNQASISIGFASGISFADYFTGYLFNSTTVIELLETTNAGILSAITNAEFTDTASIVISMTYLVS